MAIGECTDLNWKATRRNELVEQYWSTTKYTSPPLNRTITREEERQYDKLWEKTIDIYNAEIPLIELSRCPICNEKLYYELDVLGLDSPRWDVDHPDEDKPKVKCCTHFRALMGAIDFHDRDPVEANRSPMDRDIQPGPGVPFVVPDVLTKTPGMTVVIASFEGPHGDTYYPIGYFSPEPANPANLPPSWSRETLKIYGPDGEIVGWTLTNHEWDFELQPWIDEKKVVWIPPGGDEIVREGPCPYVDLPGIRKPQLIERDKVKTMYLPDGSKLNPFGD
jgi:hypothetical protein